jgi:hypothetical protein
LQLWVDDERKSLDRGGIELGSGARVVRSADGQVFEIEFPNGTQLIATPKFWPTQQKWYMNVNVYQTTASEGIMGALARGSWLPALPNGGSLGAKPAAEHDRYVALNQQFANAWRITDKTKSLFAYADGTSPATFNKPIWPPEQPPCTLQQEQGADPLPKHEAENVCAGVKNTQRKAHCVFDVSVTGERGFAELYLLTERLEDGATISKVYVDRPTSRNGEAVTLSAVVARKALHMGNTPTGKVQLILDDAEAGAPIPLDSNGRAEWKRVNLTRGRHRIAVQYIPDKAPFLSSSSAHTTHDVIER